MKQFVLRITFDNFKSTKVVLCVESESLKKSKNSIIVLFSKKKMLISVQKVVWCCFYVCNSVVKFFPALTSTLPLWFENVIFRVRQGIVQSFISVLILWKNNWRLFVQLFKNIRVSSDIDRLFCFEKMFSLHWYPKTNLLSKPRAHQWIVWQKWFKIIVFASTSCFFIDWTLPYM